MRENHCQGIFGEISGVFPMPFLWMPFRPCQVSKEINKDVRRTAAGNHDDNRVSRDIRIDRSLKEH